MKGEFVPLSYIALAAKATFEHPAELPELVRLDSPAVDVMTDFRSVQPVTVSPDVPIDDALEKMKAAHVRLLLVINDDEEIIGTITAKIIQGSTPIKMVQEKRIPRSDITVETIMTPQPEVTVLNMVNVRNAQVGHIVKTLQQLDRKHILVVEIDSTTKTQRVRGLFSSSQISRQLGVPVTGETPAAQTLAEIQGRLG